MTEQSHFQTPTILIVDDDRDTRSVIRQSLSVLNYQCLEAEDGVSAQLECKKSLPDLIVLDVMMPRMTGIEFVKWFRSEVSEPFIPVLMLTALGDVERKVEGLTSGADDYLVKPFNYRELQARVQALLRIKELTNDLFRQTAELLAANARLTEMQQELLQKERELATARLAGAAAHNIGQPLTAALLQCQLLDKSVQTLQTVIPEVHQRALERVCHTSSAIRHECEAIKDILYRMQHADPNAITDYVSGRTILDLKK